VVTDRLSMACLLLLISLLTPTPLWAAGACDLFKELFPHLLGTEAELLAKFRPRNVVSVTRPPVGKTLILETRDGVSYILRAPSEFASIAFERFATEIILDAPVGRIPRVRKLTPLEIEKLSEKIPAGTFRGSIDLAEARSASIAVFYPMEDGKSYLGSRNSTLFLRDLLLSFALTKDAVETAREWELFFPASSPENLRSLASELAGLGGVFSGITPGNLFERIDKLIQSGGEPFAPLLEKAVNEIPMPVLKQLADQWVLITLLGFQIFTIPTGSSGKGKS